MTRPIDEFAEASKCPHCGGHITPLYYRWHNKKTSNRRAVGWLYCVKDDRMFHIKVEVKEASLVVRH